jgi:hypothetical protein
MVCYGWKKKGGRERWGEEMQRTEEGEERKKERREKRKGEGLLCKEGEQGVGTIGWERGEEEERRREEQSVQVGEEKKEKKKRENEV